MNILIPKYYLDANVLIQAWQKYYSPRFCESYWKVLEQMGQEGIIAIPEMVYEEITRTEDDLCEWLKGSQIPIEGISEAVSINVKKIFDSNPAHKRLVDSTTGRSLADPWVIAHAMNNNGTVVTKEVKVDISLSNKVKIPNVCENLTVKCINDFQMIEELNIKFDCLKERVEPAETSLTSNN